MEDHLRFWMERGEKDLQHALDAAFLELNNAFGRWWAFHGKGIVLQAIENYIYILIILYISRFKLQVMYLEQRRLCLYCTITSIFTLGMLAIVG